MTSDEPYAAEHRALQDRFDTRRLADRLAQVTMSPTVSEADEAFIASRDFFFLATVDAEGQPSCSFKGGPTGFVRVVDRHTLAFPSYDGNGMYLSMGNLLAHPQVGLLFVDFEHPNRLRVQGTATVDDADPLLAEYPEAQLVVRVAVTRTFPNCPRYLPKMTREHASPFVPEPGKVTPFAPWKQLEFFRDALSASDAERAATMPTLGIEEYVATLE